MPRIFDNIDLDLLPALRDTLAVSSRADFCVGYFNLRGWRKIDDHFESWPGGPLGSCRLLVGMQVLPQDELREALRLDGDGTSGIDQQIALRLKKRMAQEFREQLIFGAPTDDDEAGLRRLARQLRAKKVFVKLHLRYPLHAKLYLLHREDPNNPTIGFLGSSNLTLAGLRSQGELNVDVLDHDACDKLQRWFDQRWNDRWCLDISDELAEIIETSWARADAIPPYHIYLKIAYHLSQEARTGLAEFTIPHEFQDKLFSFQSAAVKIAAHHLNKRGGVLIGDVVGLGKTMVATALVRLLEQENDGISTLIICPKNLTRMWQEYVDRFGMRAKVISMSTVERELDNAPARFRRVLIDESHNLRNREGRRYKVIHDYIHHTESKCILLSATPYNKSFLDLSNQLRLFVSETTDLGIRPEQLLRDMGELQFSRMHQCPVRSLAAFEKSPYSDDWRELMRLYLIRRTRGFIQLNHADLDAETGRRYLTFEDGTRSYFPTRRPKSVIFEVVAGGLPDQYARLYADDVVDGINKLSLPRYGLGNYIASAPKEAATPHEAERLRNLSRAGKRLMGFCRTNLFKRLESSGSAFLQSLERHLLRNYVFLHAIDNGLPIPIGTQDSAILDTRLTDNDPDEDNREPALFEGDDTDPTVGARHGEPPAPHASPVLSPSGVAPAAQSWPEMARRIYGEYATAHVRRFEWLRPSLFAKSLGAALRKDCESVQAILRRCGGWEPRTDSKLNALASLLTQRHSDDKVLIFTQFADTARYIGSQLKQRGVCAVEAVTGGSSDPTLAAWRFSPHSNGKSDDIRPNDETRVLIATDVLSEGQNLQDCSIIVNYDLPWAIIRLIQRAGRVDRIGQQAQDIHCYSFLPADGVERIIRLRAKVRQRLRENAEVVGADEAFFEDDGNDAAVVSLYNEQAGILDDDDSEVDLSSYAYQIWKNAIDADPRLEKIIPALPNVVYSTRSKTPPSALHVGETESAIPGAMLIALDEHAASVPPYTSLPAPPVHRRGEDGVLVYLRTAQDNDALAWVDGHGNSITESQFQILKAAECPVDAPAAPRHARHHDLVQQAVKQILHEEQTTGGQLGRPSGARYRAYQRLKHYSMEVIGTLLSPPELQKTIDDIYRYPLRAMAADTLNRQMKAGISDDALAELAMNLRAEDRLCQIHNNERTREPQLICSLGLVVFPPA